MKENIKNLVVAILLASIITCACALLQGCDLTNEQAAANYAREATAAKYTSEYATTVNKLEMKEGNFKTYRRVVFYNVRLGETVFVCEGYSHVQIDKDGDVELVVKVGQDSYLRHYLGHCNDMVYWSQQLKENEITSHDRYEVVWNPKLWFPKFTKGEIGE